VNIIKLTTTVFISIVLSSCGGMEKSLERVAKTFNRQAAIKYTAQEVIISYFDYRTAPYQAGNRIQLKLSNGQVVGYGVFKTERGLGNAISLVARIPMPRSIPMETTDTCFYIESPDRTVIPVRTKKGEEGFKNPIWQLGIANPVRLTYFSNKNVSLKNDIAKLNKQKSRSSNYINRSAPIVDGQCIVSQPSHQKPKPPFSLPFIAAIKAMPFAICSSIKIPGLSEKAKSSLSSTSLEAFSVPTSKDFSNATKTYKHDLTNGSINRKYNNTATQLLAKGRVTSNCTARSDCSTRDELYYGSRYRKYSLNYSTCIIQASTNLRSEMVQHQSAVTKWKKEPIDRKNFCLTQLNFLSSVDGTIENKQREIAENENILKTLHSNKGITVMNTLTEADSSTCSIY